MSKHVREADDATFRAEVLDAAGPVLVDFWAEWCGPCRMQGPIVERFAEAHPDVKVVKVDVDSARQVAGDYGIRSIPTIAVFQGGKLVASGVGVHRENGLADLIEKARSAA